VSQDFLNEFEAGNGFSVACIEDSRGVRGFGGKCERADDVLYENKMLRLITVTIDRYRLSAERAVEKKRHGGGISAARVLTGTKDIEKTDARLCNQPSWAWRLQWYSPSSLVIV
jgi:hypothetical protein